MIEIADIGKKTFTGYWFASAALLAAGPGAAEAGLLGADAITLTGAVGLTTLLWLRAPGAVAAVVGILAGLNVTMLTLVLWPPCESVFHLRLVEGPDGADVQCVKFQDVTGLAILSLAGSAAVVGLLILRRRLAMRVDPSIG